MTGSPRFLLAVCQNMRWTNGGAFASAREAEREQKARVALGEGDTRVLTLRGRDPQTVLAGMRRSLVIVRQGAERKLLIGFYFAPPHPNPNLNLHRRPIFKPKIDVGMVVKFLTVNEACACLQDVRAFAPDAFIGVVDWQEEPRPDAHVKSRRTAPRFTTKPRGLVDRYFAILDKVGADDIWRPELKALRQQMSAAEKKLVRAPLRQEREAAMEEADGLEKPAFTDTPIQRSEP